MMDSQNQSDWSLRDCKNTYVTFKHTPGMWRCTNHSNTFTLAVDNFGVKYFSKDDTNHLSSALQDKYSITTDWSDGSYLHIAINYN